MTDITQIYFWDDPGFTDGAVEVPAFANLSTLPTPDFTSMSGDEWHPSKDRIFTELKLSIPFTVAQYFSYLKIRVEFKNGNSRTRDFYGFVDSVEILSDTDDYPAVLIKWHVDLWRTFMGSAVFGPGTVTRRSRGVSDPIQHVPSRFKRVSDRVYNLIPDTLVGSGAHWAIINYTHETTGGTGNVTESRIIVCPVARTPNTIYYMQLSSSSTAYRVPTLNQWLLGEYDEIFGLAPSSISSVFLSPVPPLAIASGTGVVSDPFVVVGPSVYPEPETRSYAGVDRPAGAFLGSDQVDLTDGDRILFRDWESRKIHTARGITSSGSGYSNQLIATVIQDGTAIVSSVGSADNPGAFISAISVDDFVRAVLSETVFDNLSDGDTVQFSNIVGLYASGSISQTINSIAVGSSLTNILSWTVSVGETVPSDTELTFTNGTFGSYWIAVQGVISSSSVSLTTYSEATTTADYGVEIKTHGGVDYMYLFTKTNKFAEYTGSLPSGLTTTDTEQFVVTDLDGSVIGSIPWGLTVKDFTFRCVVSASSGYVQFRFDGLNSSAEGLQFTIPLPSLDITSNSWSEYNFSGQRDFDIEQRKIARDRALVEGLGGALAGGAQGAMIGGLKESQTFMPTDRSIANASAFGLLGAGASVAGTLINYASAGHYNDKLQSATDMLQAKQLDSIITPGNGCDWLYYGRPYQIRSIVPDAYSLARFDQDVALNGISVSEPTADCTELVHGSGPLAIDNLVVRGDIPVEAKQYIKQKLNKGVRLK